MTPLPPDPDLLLFPRLTRFYGLSYEELMRMPRAAFRIYLDAYVELAAEEQLHTITAVTFPYSDKDERSRIIRYLSRRATPARPESEQVDPTGEEGVKALAGIGIKVTRK